MEIQLALDSSRNLVEQIIYLMGTSFILGSLITILLLMLLDFMRARRTRKNANS
jgi:hypothetical protein